jgi:hypothetical protein
VSIDRDRRKAVAARTDEAMASWQSAFLKRLERTAHYCFGTIVITIAPEVIL